jgi:hypothetical protein
MRLTKSARVGHFEVFTLSLGGVTVGTLRCSNLRYFSNVPPIGGEANDEMRNLFS